ncbi:MAG: ATP-dependent RNA helicase HrpA [Methylobacter sp.]|nr:ATP-dependent RNA helicase HrpA [Methylobacter sp.]MDP2429154.1 ATP-dependent RNA helicase HrpA [Methylobacter sp.]MDP3053383.1 ATP-dependent RNA helicase HrpA [Methylobacter sp.]MDP3360738.1 ATP-dependent RNA helicase HrpA [Methylobacter sp.]MDZ4218049.1 ATP-dependent RNA helicase HrpA [Methylobacter sp.]
MSTPDLFKQLSLQLAQCLNQDRPLLKRQLDRCRSKKIPEELNALAARIERSVAARNKRLANFPVLTFPDLPVTGKKDDIAQLIQDNQVVILCGETGSGKTTQLPKICLSIGRGAAGFIGHTQPRRIAARTVADRIAEELGEPMGKSVGYKIRFNDKTHADSLIKLMTDGILLAESQNDPYLNQYDTIIIDEAHERSLNIDFLIGYMKWLLPKRPDLKLIITSATIDTQRFSTHFNNAPIIEVSGRTYPVEMRYRPIVPKEEADGEKATDETGDELQNAILDAVDELYRDLRGDILIFLSGEREIRETADSLKKHHPTQYEILPLYSKLSVSEQERVFKPKGGKLRIVLATNVAETSLTVPGIRCVIDTGHARISRYSHRSKIQRLPIERISQSSANQRAGRCGRVAEGICIRLYSHDDYLARPEFTEPEIMRTNLSAVILQMISLKLGDIEDFPFIEPPEDKMIRDGKTVLHEVNALDKAGKLTEVGKQLAKFPTDPKLARMLIAAAHEHCLTEVAIIVAALSVQDPREKPADKMAQADQKHAAFRHPESDFLTLVNVWNIYEDKKKHLSNSKLRKYCTDNFLSYMRMREWFDIHAQIMQVVKGDLKMTPNTDEAGYEKVHRALLPGLLSNIGFRHEQYEYLGARGLKFFIFPGSGLHKLKPKWIMAAEQVETSKVYARNVARIEPEWIEHCAEHLVKQNYYDPHWSKKGARCMVSSRTLLYGLTLQAGRKIPYDHVDPKAAREIFIRSALVDHDYHSNARFYVANQKLLEEVGMIQHKGRRVDLVEDEQWLYDFYDSKLPPEVFSGVTLDTWRKTVERDNPKILFLTKDDLTREHEEDYVNEWDFPDSRKVGNLTIPLQYRFEPGHDEDGVTAIIPVHQLNQVTQTAFDWLVPGLLEEKCIALIKALPKNIRKHFVPVPETVKQCLEIEPDFKGALPEWLGNRLRKLTGEAIPLNAWNTETLTDHLQMNFRVVDDQGQLLDYGRDLKTLQLKHTAKAVDSFDQIAADELNYTGCIGWAFDDLPETYQFIQNGQAFVGYPAIIDEGDAVGVRIFDTEQKAAIQHQAGLMRLFQLQLRKECTYIAKNMPKSAAVELTYNRLPKHPLLDYGFSPSYKDDLLYVALYGVFVEGQTIRSQQAFEQIMQANKAGLISAANEAGKTALDIMELYGAIKTQLNRLNANDPLAKDINEQLDLLIYAGFIRNTPYQQLKAIPRYLKAIQYRLDKRDNTPQKVQEVSRYAIRYWRDVEKKAKKDKIIPEQELFRWMLEEFRVSQFAQQLKTAYPVSVKRMDKAWDERG